MKRSVVLPFLLLVLPVLAGDWPPSYGEGKVLWESNRSGAWRVYERPLLGGEARQVTPDEEGRSHFAPQYDPTGRYITYLSFPEGFNGYRKHTPRIRVPLRLLDLQSGESRDLLDNARPYGEHRAVVWVDPDTLVVLDHRYRTKLLRLPSGETTPLVDTPPAGNSWDHGYLVDHRLNVAFSGLAGFHRYDPGTLSVVQGDTYPGCQPFVTRDGVWGVWMWGLGGPIRRRHLASQRVETILEKDDPRLPKGRGYLYFPAISPCQRVLVFAASPNQHDHHTSDYDLFAFRLDPQSLEPQGLPLRLTEDPATDRFPDVWLPGPAAQAEDGAAPAILPDSFARDWPANDSGLLLAWEDGVGLRQVLHASGVPSALQWDRKGRARWTAAQTLLLDGGWALSNNPLQPVAKALETADAFSLELLLTPRAAKNKEPGTVLCLESPKLRLWQNEAQLLLDIGGSTAPFDLGPAGDHALHLLVAVEPGRLRVYRDGRLAQTHGILPWESGGTPGEPRMSLGADPDGAADWQGEIEGLALYARALDAREASENARLLEDRRAKRAPVLRHHVQARLVAASPVPTLEQIAPYRELQVLHEYERVGDAEASGPPARFRVRHWAWLDGQRQALPAETPGETARLHLESMEDHPHLAQDYLSDGLDFDVDTPVFLDARP